jgi:hypothetical protein
VPLRAGARQLAGLGQLRELGGDGIAQLRTRLVRLVCLHGRDDFVERGGPTETDDEAQHALLARRRCALAECLPGE